jgi:hypothetical protein
MEPKEYYQAKIKEAYEIALGETGDIDVWALAIFEKIARPWHYAQKEQK